MESLLKFAATIVMFAVAGFFMLSKMNIKQTIFPSGAAIVDLLVRNTSNAIASAYGRVVFFLVTSVKQLSAPRRSCLGVA